MTDKYSTFARIAPATLMMLPVAILSAGLALDFGVTYSVGAAGAAFLPSLLIGEILRDRAKRAEPEMFERWDGPPTTRFVRHADTTLPRQKKTAIRRQLTALSRQELPSPQQELDNPAEADATYSLAIAACREKFRDQTKYQRLFSELTAYGFRRNLYAAKPYSLAFTILSALALALTCYKTASLEDIVKVLSFVCLEAVVALVWVFGVTESFVRRSAENYAHALLDAIANEGVSPTANGDA